MIGAFRRNDVVRPNWGLACAVSIDVLLWVALIKAFRPG